MKILAKQSNFICCFCGFGQRLVLVSICNFLLAIAIIAEKCYNINRSGFVPLKGVKNLKKITIVTGHYGTGKTNLSVNLALMAAEEFKSVTVVDLDLVNPYFRTADFRQLFESHGIRLIAPDFANSNLDIPSVQFDIEELAREAQNSGGCLIIDVGGDDAGAFALGRYAEALNSADEKPEMLYVINQRRSLTETADAAVELMYDIEKASRMKHTAIVNNTNLGAETTAEIILQSADFANAAAEKTGLPLKWNTYPEELCSLGETSALQHILPVKVYVKPLWEV